MADNQTTINPGSGGSEVRTVTTQLPLKTQDQGLDTTHQQAVVLADREGDVEDPLGQIDLLKQILERLDRAVELLETIAQSEEKIGEMSDETDDDDDDMLGADRGN